MGVYHELAATQHGVVTRRQLLDLGMSSSAIDRAIAAGKLLVLKPGAYGAAGSSDMWERRAMVVQLSAGEDAVLSHLAAAAIWELVDRKPKRIEVTTPRDRGARGAHRPRTLQRCDVRRRKGFRVTSPPRTIVDLAAVLSADALEDVLDRALLRGLVTVDVLRRQIDGRKPKGKAKLLRLIHNRDERGTPEGEIERRFERLIVKAKLPMPVRQYKVGTRRIDYAYVEQLIAIELDGRGEHGKKAVFEDDRKRQNELVLEGWTVLRFTWDDVTKRSDEVIETIGRALSR